MEANDRGFRHVLFDDNWPVYALYAYPLPRTPEISLR